MAIEEILWKNLSPHIIRQRAIIEGLTNKIVTRPQIKDYLIKLADVSDMEIVSGPYTSTAHELGFSGWVNWRTSGAHFYSYPGGVNPLDPTANPTHDYALFTLDTYTCKPFSVEKVVEFTKDYFKPVDLVWKEVFI